MAWYRCGGGGLPAGLQSDMDTVLNKKFSTSTTYPPTDWPDTVNLMGPLPEKTASGSIANITDGADGVPLKNWLVTLPASLSGYSEVNGTQTGKNLLNPAYVENNYHLSNTTGLPQAFNGRIATTTPVSVHGGTITVSFVTAVSNIFFMYSTFKNGTLIERVANKSSGDSINLQDADELYICIYGNSSISTSDISDIQIEVGSTATAYKAYTAPTQYTASLGRTIYGGTADIVTGEGEATHTRYEITGTETGYFLAGTNNNGNRIDFAISGAQTPLYSGGLSNYGENKACLNSGTWTIGAWCIYNSRLFVVVPNEYDTFAKALEYLVNEHTQFVYPLATSTAFTLTPITPTPETALGVNNFWSDEGDSDVTYRADISLAIQALGGGGRGLMMMRPTEPEETEETEETEGLEDELNR